MKKLIYNILKSNTRLYDFIFNEILTDRRLEATDIILGDSKVINDQFIESKHIANIENCTLINVNLYNCKIDSITRCVMRNTHLQSYTEERLVI
jgi:hypothetical protein